MELRRGTDVVATKPLGTWSRGRVKVGDKGRIMSIEGWPAVSRYVVRFDNGAVVRVDDAEEGIEPA